MTRRCQQEGCRQPVVVIDHGKPYPLADVVVICFDPMTVRCWKCKEVSVWESAKAG